MIKAWRLAWRNLARNFWRNVGTGSAIAFGFAGLVIVGGYVMRIDDFLSVASIYLDHAGHVSIYADGGLERSGVKPRQYSLSADAQTAIAEVVKADPRVEHVGRYLSGIGLAGNGCKTVPFMAKGIEPEDDRWVRQHPHVAKTMPDLARPVRGLTLGDATGEPRPASLSTGLARLLGKSRVKSELPALRPGPRIYDCDKPGATEQLAASSDVQLLGMAFDGSVSVIDADLVGIHTTGLAQTEDSSVIVPLAKLQELYNTDKVTYMAVYLRDVSNVQSYAHDLEARLRARGLSVSVFAYDDERISRIFVGTHAFLMAMASFMGTIVFLVVVLSIINSMTMTILERTREIGTFRSLGFTRRNMIGLFLRESMILTAVGVAIGLAFALGVCLAVNAANLRFSPPGIAGDMQFRLEPGAMLCIAFAVVMIALSAVATTLTVRGRIKLKVAELNTAVTG